MPRLSILSYSIALNLEPDLRQWCIEEWQNYQPGTAFDDLISQHKLWSTLEFCCRQNQLWEHLPEAFKHQVRTNRRQCAFRHLQLLYQLEELDAALTAKGLECILLKGSALLFHPIYPSLGDRSIADIDIAVLPEQIPDFVEVLRGLNYSTESSILPPVTDRTRHLPPFVRPKSLHIEIHPLGTFHQMVRQFSEEIETTAQHPEGFTAIEVPAPTELFWHIAWHAWFGPPQLRNILDLYRLQSLYPIDLDMLAQRAKDKHLERCWTLLLQQMAELAAGKPSRSTIHRWEWYPRFRSGDSIFLPDRTTSQVWKDNLLVRPSRFQHSLLAFILYPGVILARLWFVAVTHVKWLFSMVGFISPCGKTSAIARSVWRRDESRTLR